MLILAFFFLFPLFSTLTVPLLLSYFQFGPYEGVFAHGEALALAISFALITFYIPAGFLRVSRTGALISAFAVAKNLRVIRVSFRRYLEAWIGSSLMSLIGHLCVPLSPFGVVWCYLGIVYCFNEVPLNHDKQAEEVYLENSWFTYFRAEHWSGYKCRRKRMLEMYARRTGDSGPLGEGAESFSALSVGPLRVPLP